MSIIAQSGPECKSFLKKVSESSFRSDPEQIGDVFDDAAEVFHGAAERGLLPDALLFGAEQEHHAADEQPGAHALDDSGC